MRRRDFIRSMAPVAFLGGFKINALSHLPFMDGLQGATDNDHVLVLVQLIGGNDGVNTVIPIGPDYGGYVAARDNIAIPEGRVLSLSKYPKTGLHPALSGLKSLYDNDKLAIVQAVGYPFPDGSHFRSTDIWLTGADADKFLETGWAGRFLTETYTNFPVGYPNETMPDPLAIQIGSVISPVFMSQAGTTAMAVPTDTEFYDLINGITEPEPDTPMGNELTYLRAVARQTNKYADVIEAAAKKITSQSPYPQGELAAQLKTVARLIAGGLKTKVYMVSFGGFDTHGGQVQGNDTTTGSHATLLKQMSDAITAFMNDCQNLGVGRRVLGMTFSEFGRRIMSNGSMGTDHGAAQPVFIFGEYAATGVLGNNPILAGINGGTNVQMQYDFRSIYSTILRDWFCVPASVTTTMLLKNYQYLPFMKNTACGNTYDNLNDLGDKLISNSPNPFTDSTDIQFKTAGGHTLVQIFDASGRLVMVPVDQEYTQGTYKVTVYTNTLAAGVYYARLQNQSVQQVRTLLKVRR